MSKIDCLIYEVVPYFQMVDLTTRKIEFTYGLFLDNIKYLYVI